MVKYLSVAWKWIKKNVSFKLVLIVLGCIGAYWLFAPLFTALKKLFTGLSDFVGGITGSGSSKADEVSVETVDAYGDMVNKRNLTYQYPAWYKSKAGEIFAALDHWNPFARRIADVHQVAIDVRTEDDWQAVVSQFTPVDGLSMREYMKEKMNYEEYKGVLDNLRSNGINNFN
jgi:hypothetical protein